MKTTFLMTLSKKKWQEFSWETSFKIKKLELKYISNDSRKIKKDWGFFAYDGANYTADTFIWEALLIQKAVVFIDYKYKEIIEKDKRYKSDLPIFYNKDFSKNSSKTVSYLFEEPSKRLTMIGITGTNGKTTIAHSLHQVLATLNEKSMYIGTLGAYMGDVYIPLKNTTPDIFQINSLLSRAYRKKIKKVFVEASSHGLLQNRLHDIDWNIGIFTNLTNDHLDYHKSLYNYFQAKKILFKEILANSKSKKGQRAIIILLNNDYSYKLYDWLKKQNPNIPIIGIGNHGEVQLHGIQFYWSGYQTKFNFKNKTYHLKTNFLGSFNLFNLLSVYVATYVMQYKSADILQAISKIYPPEGRMQIVERPEEKNIIIDYAHTPDALKNVIDTVRELNPIRIILVFGCGGERDVEKRPMMGRIAITYADFVIITNDNPRSEDPQSIVNDIKKEIESNKYIVVFDREKAIRSAFQIQGPKEVIIIAGKGHETYQILKEKTIHFSDIEMVNQIIKENEKS